MDHRLSGADRASRKKFNEQAMTLEAELYLDDDTEEIVQFPAKFELCPTCNGKGSHVNPGIDSHGITSDEWHNNWSYEEREQYMSGGYDVSCYECNGRRVVPVVDEDRCSDDIKGKLALWNKQLEAQARYDSEYRKEVEMGY